MISQLSLYSNCIFIQSVFLNNIESFSLEKGFYSTFVVFFTRAPREITAAVDQRRFAAVWNWLRIVMVSMQFSYSVAEFLRNYYRSAYAIIQPGFESDESVNRSTTNLASHSQIKRSMLSIICLVSRCPVITQKRCIILLGVPQHFRYDAHYDLKSFCEIVHFTHISCYCCRCYPLCWVNFTHPPSKSMSIDIFVVHS